MDFAPILISVYTRKNHLVRLIHSLINNSESKGSDLFIVSDAPNTDDAIKDVSDIRSYITSIEGFNSVELIAWERNKGSHNSILDAINYVFSKYNKLIFLEDDNFVSQNFLSYLNQGLDFYNNNSKVFSISGYNYHISIPNASSQKSYFFKGYSAWGVGMWKDKWQKIDFTINLNGNDIKNHRKIIENELGEKVYISINRMVENKIIYIDALICYNLYNNDWFSVFPEISKVRNYGHDGLGEHGGNNKVFSSQIIDTKNKIFLFLKDINIDSVIISQLSGYFRKPKRNWFRSILKSSYNKLRIKKVL